MIHAQSVYQLIHVQLVLLGLKELSHIFALFFKVKGNSLSLIKSIDAPPSLKVLHTSSNSLMWAYGFSLSIPWKVGRSGTIWGLIISCSREGTMREGALILGGCILSLMDRYAFGLPPWPCWEFWSSCGGSMMLTQISNSVSWGFSILTNLPSWSRIQ